MSSFSQRRAFASALAVALVLTAGAATAQTKAPDAKKPAPVTSPVASATPAPSVTPASPATPDVKAAEEPHVEGFRSAKFGMSEADVRGAIAKDFPAAAGAIKQSFSPVERTTVLTFKSSDVLPDGGAAELSYIFGYKSKALIQVAIVWSKQSDETLTPAAILSNGEGLRSYFLAEGFAPSEMVGNAELPDGLLLFRGRDVDQHEVLLVLRGAKTPDGATTKTFTPTSVALIYVATPKDPDTYKIPAGKF